MLLARHVQEASAPGFCNVLPMMWTRGNRSEVDRSVSRCVLLVRFGYMNK
jgi:hypothetical protein